MMKRSNQTFIETRYLGPTDHRGSRVVARNVTTGKRKVISWDDALSAPDNHERAARAMLGFGLGFYQQFRGNLLSASTERGWIYTVKP